MGHKPDKQPNHLFLLADTRSSASDSLEFSMHSLAPDPNHHLLRMTLYLIKKSARASRARRLFMAGKCTENDLISWWCHRRSDPYPWLLVFAATMRSTTITEWETQLSRFVQRHEKVRAVRWLAEAALLGECFPESLETEMVEWAFSRIEDAAL